MKYLRLVLVFALCLMLGCFVGHQIKTSDSPTDTPPDPIPGPVPPPDPEEELVVMYCTKPVLQNNSYAFNVNVSNVEKYDVSYELWNISPAKKVAESGNGIFEGIPGCSSGKYRVCVLDRDADTLLLKADLDGFALSEPIPPVPPKRMTKEELQTLINSRSTKIIGGRHPLVSKNIALDVEGDYEMHGANFSNIYSMFEYDQWSSVTVKSVEYDDNNKICRAVIVPNIQ